MNEKNWRFHGTIGEVLPKLKSGYRGVAVLIDPAKSRAAVTGSGCIRTTLPGLLQNMKGLKRRLDLKQIQERYPELLLMVTHKIGKKATFPRRHEVSSWLGLAKKAPIGKIALGEDNFPSAPEPAPQPELGLPPSEPEVVDPPNAQRAADPGALSLVCPEDIAQGRVIRAFSETGSTGDTFFVAHDVADILGYRDSQNLVRLLKNEDTRDGLRPHLVRVKDRVIESPCLSFPCLVLAMFRSDKPLAVKFRGWVAHDVMDQIRRTGSFSAGGGHAEVVGSDERWRLFEASGARQDRMLEAQMAQMSMLQSLVSTMADMQKGFGHKASQPESAGYSRAQTAVIGLLEPPRVPMKEFPSDAYLVATKVSGQLITDIAHPNAPLGTRTTLLDLFPLRNEAAEILFILLERWGVVVRHEQGSDEPHLTVDATWQEYEILVPAFRNTYMKDGSKVLHSDGSDAFRSMLVFHPEEAVKRLQRHFTKLRDSKQLEQELAAAVSLRSARRQKKKA